MNINGYLNSEHIEDEDIRNSFIDFIAEQEDIIRFKVFTLEKSIEDWDELRKDFLEE